MKMMEIKEALASDWELYQRVYYGIEGEHYTVDENGKIQVSPNLNAEIITNEGIAQTFALMPITFEWMEKSMNERDALLHKMAIEQPKVYNGMDFAVSGTNMVKVVDEYYYNAIIGRVDIDSTWDSYVQSVLKAGLQDILDEYTAMYNAQN